MCGWSVLFDNIREAVNGEPLTLKPFPHTRAFVSPQAPNVAVCMRSGTTFMVRNVPEDLQQAYRIGPEHSALFFERRDMGTQGNPDEHTDWMVFNGCREAFPMLKLPLDTVIDVLEVGEISATNFETNRPVSEIAGAPMPDRQTQEAGVLVGTR
jgi:hypothetical protein